MNKYLKDIFIHLDGIPMAAIYELIKSKKIGSKNVSEAYTNILDAEDFFTRSQEDKLKEKDLCFTFDDGIKNQYDIALPILEDF